MKSDSLHSFLMWKSIPAIIIEKHQWVIFTRTSFFVMFPLVESVNHEHKNGT
ncbi:hypothetical protein M3699_14500 [Peribacillus simplex]|uniref:hypothetical protein n=1 Tax=Peribacillus simplex TaxID=1478 RepID=UPI00203BA103|nr:hypothetical protein [Peribacillus simplex]MCM3675062.1 hypothetical protein [Peribacillus simplex]